MRKALGLLLTLSIVLTGCVSTTTPAQTPATAPAAPTTEAPKPAPAAPKPPRTFKIAVSVTNLVFAAISVAINEGYFAEEGLVPEFVELAGGGEVLNALQSGNVDVAAGAGSSLILAASRGMNNIVCVANMIDRQTIEVGMRKELAEKFGMTPSMPLNERLLLMKGLNVAVTSAGSASDNFLRTALRSVNLDPDKDANVVAMGNMATIQVALQRGQVDTIAASPPTVQQAEFAGSGVPYFKGSELPGGSDIIYDGLFVTRKAVENDPEFVQGLVNALHKANEFIKNNPAAAAKGLQENQMSKVEPALVEAGLKALLDAYTVNMTTKTWENTLQIVVEAGSLKVDAPDLSTVWTDKFLKQLPGAKS